jgi:hypothetical protein
MVWATNGGAFIRHRVLLASCGCGFFFTEKTYPHDGEGRSVREQAVQGEREWACECVSGL